MSSKLFLAALATGAMAAAPAMAQPARDEAPSLRVTYADLNMSTPEGAQTLMGRVNVAARTVCGGWNVARSRDLGARAAYHGCHDRAVSEAVASANQPMLTELYDQHHQTARAVLAAR